MSTLHDRASQHNNFQIIPLSRPRIEVQTPNPDGSYSRRPATEEESVALMDAHHRAIEQSGVGCGTSELLSNPIAGAWRRASAHERDVFVRHWAADLRQIMKEIKDADAAPQPAEGNGDDLGVRAARDGAP